MNWWGKVIGGTFGFLLGGPLGAMLGAALGHNFDKGLGSMSGFGGAAGVNVERIQSAFFTSTFSVMGFVAKVDGKVTPDEIAMAENIMLQMRLSPEQKKVAISLFNKGKANDFDLDMVLDQFRLECHRRTNLLQMFLEIQIATALADHTLDAMERKTLAHIAGKIGFSSSDFINILQRAQASSHMHQQRPDSAAALNDAYKLLGIEKSANDGEVKKAYRRLMNQHHPDKLVAKGLPQEMMDMAAKKTMEIKDAYELVKKSRE